MARSRNALSCYVWVSVRGSQCCKKGWLPGVERRVVFGKAAARLVNGTGMDREYKVMYVTGGVYEGVWPLVGHLYDNV